MRQVIEDAPQYGQIVILNDDVDDVDAGCRNENTARFGRTFAVAVFARKRRAALCVVAALLATAWTCQARCSSDRWDPSGDARSPAQQNVSVPEFVFREQPDPRASESVRVRRVTAELVRLAQAAPDDPEELRNALQQERAKAELLARELAVHRHLEMLLTLHQARAEGARFQHPETGHSKD